MVRFFSVAVAVSLALLTSSLLYAADNSTPTHGITTFGTLKYPADFTHFDYVNPDAPKGGSVVLSAIGTFDSVNPYVLKGKPAIELSMMYDTLLVSAKDEPSSSYGLVAESMEVAQDRSSVKFYLRKEARFHDHTPLTAEDVVFSFNTLKKQGHPIYRAYYRDVVRAEALSRHVVKFTFAGTDNRELPLIIGQLPVLSKAYYKTHTFDKSTLEPPLGSGPYRISAIDPGRSISYQRVPDYWGKDLPVNKGQFNFDTIRFDYYRDATVALEAFKAGKYDFRLENIARNWATAYAIPAFKAGYILKEQIKHSIPQGMQGFIFNIRRPKFQDIRVREALGYAVDFEWLNKNLFYSAYTRLESYFSNSMFAATELPSSAEIALLTPFKDALPNEVFTTVYHTPRTDGTGYGIRENLTKAKALLDAAGWHIKQGKLIHEQTGEVMKIEFLLDQPVYERAIAPVVRNLEKLGVEATIRTIDNAQYQKRTQSFDFDMIIETFAQSSSPGNEQINYWHSSKADVEGSRNLIGIKNPAIDAMVEHILHAQDLDGLVAATRALDRILLWNHYVMPNWYSQSFRMAYWNKFGQPALRPIYDSGFDSWWIDQEKEQALNLWRKSR